MVDKTSPRKVASPAASNATSETATSKASQRSLEDRCRKAVSATLSARSSFSSAASSANSAASSEAAHARDKGLLTHPRVGIYPSLVPGHVMKKVYGKAHEFGAASLAPEEEVKGAIARGKSKRGEQNERKRRQEMSDIRYEHEQMESERQFHEMERIEKNTQRSLLRDAMRAQFSGQRLDRPLKRNHLTQHSPRVIHEIPESEATASESSSYTKQRMTEKANRERQKKTPYGLIEGVTPWHSTDNQFTSSARHPSLVAGGRQSPRGSARSSRSDDDLASSMRSSLSGSRMHGSGN